jgi:hypothetical protein
MSINQWQRILENAARRNFRHLPTTIATPDHEPPEGRIRNSLPATGGGRNGGGKSRAGGDRGASDPPLFRQAGMMAPAPDYGFGSPYNETDLFAGAPGGSLDAPPGTFTPLDDVLLDSLDPATAQSFLDGAAPPLSGPYASPLPSPPPQGGREDQTALGAIAAPLMARGIGWLQNVIQTPRHPAGPRLIVDAFGRVIGMTDGSDASAYGGAGFGGVGGAWSGAANDASSFSGGMPGVGNYTGPNPGPTDPDYGYV